MPTKRRSASESAKRQAIPALAVDALEIPDQQRPEIDPRRQRRPPVLGRIELRAPNLDKLIELLRLQQLIQPLIERMPRSRCQLRVRDPDVLLLLPLLPRPHRHARHSTNNACGYFSTFRSRIQAYTTGC